MKLEWDEPKNAINIEKHGYDFKDAHDLFESDRLVFLDTRRDYGEPRHITLGYIGSRLVVAVYTERTGTLRIIYSTKGEHP